jgi:hypothetical protein
VLQEFYTSGEVQQWHGYNLLGVDGSTTELPNSAEIQKECGVFKHRNDGKAICMRKTLMVIFYSIQIIKIHQHSICHL